MTESGGIEAMSIRRVKAEAKKENQNLPCHGKRDGNQSIFDRRRSRELPKTVMSERAMAAAATRGFSNPNAARGMARILYINAKKRFWRIFFMVARDRRIAVATPCRLEPTRTMPPVSLATSLPEPSAIPRSDWARA